MRERERRWGGGGGYKYILTGVNCVFTLYFGNTYSPPSNSDGS